VVQACGVRIRWRISPHYRTTDPVKGVFDTLRSWLTNVTDFRAAGIFLAIWRTGALCPARIQVSLDALYKSGNRDICHSSQLLELSCCL
jgi:hypothetical protein